MSTERSLGPERLPAHSTHVGPLVAVQHRVGLEGARRHKRLAARVTHVLLGHGLVQPVVGVAGSLRLVHLAAQLALVGGQRHGNKVISVYYCFVFFISF